MRDVHSEKDFQYAKNGDLEVRVDFVRPSTPVEYRLAGDNEWLTTPYQSADVNNMGVEGVLVEVERYLDSL